MIKILIKKSRAILPALVITVLLVCPGLRAAAQTDDDISSAGYYAKKYKDDDIMCTASYRSFTFDKGKNALGDKVVTIEENSEYEFLSLKKFAGMAYPEYYNRFIELNSFKKSVKYGNKYLTSDKSGIDRSVTDDGVFFDDSRVQFYPIRFYQQGQMAKVNVKKTYLDGKYLTTLYFNCPYPVKEQSFDFKVPDWMTVEFKKMNFDGYRIDAVQNTKGGYTHYMFTMKDIPAYKSEYHRIGRAYTDPHIILQIRSFSAKGETVKGFDKVDDAYAWNNRLYQMAGNEKGKLQSTVTKITQGKTTDMDKIKAVYYWVQDNIRYIAYEDGYSGYIPSTAQDVLSKKYGDCKGMANLLTEMLKVAGFDAHFTWIGTRHLPYTQDLPALCVNNHAISTLNFGGKTYFLDATESYVPLNENAFRIQGKEVMISDGDKFEIKKVPLTDAADNSISTSADFVLTDNNTLKGKVKVILIGNERTDFHQEYQTMPSSAQKDFINDYLEFGNDNMIATEVKTSDLKNRELPVTIEGNVDLSNTVNTISGDKYVGVDFFPKSLDRFIPDEKRVEGYDFDDALKFDDNITLTIPADKKFVDKPDDLELKFPGYEFKGSYTVNGNKITLSKSLSIKNNLVQKSDFPNWKKFIDSIKEFNKYLISIANK